MTDTKTLLVTGGAGFIGSTFVGQMVDKGHKVIVLDALTYAGHPENLDYIENTAGFELVVGNICDPVLVPKLLVEHQVDAVVNFAAESHVDNSITGSAIFIETNINGTYNMLESSRQYWDALEGAKKENFRFVQISTDEVYGSLGAEGYFTEDSRIEPSSPYSASKAAGDHLARAWFETYKFPALTTNCTNNYGARQFPEKLIPAMITRALSGEPLGIYGSGENVRDWIHVEDHCNGIYLALTKGTLGEVYCFGGRNEKNNIETVHAICDVLDDLRPRADGKSYKEQITFVGDRKGHDFRYAMDDKKAEEKLGFTRIHKDFTTGMRDTVEWYLANDAWCQAVTSKQKAA
jgi:dTDP-glucose 4,6-dehydratase